MRLRTFSAEDNSKYKIRSQSLDIGSTPSNPSARFFQNDSSTIAAEGAAEGAAEVAAKSAAEGAGAALTLHGKADAACFFFFFSASTADLLLRCFGTSARRRSMRSCWSRALLGGSAMAVLFLLHDGCGESRLLSLSANAISSFLLILSGLLLPPLPPLPPLSNGAVLRGDGEDSLLTRERVARRPKDRDRLRTFGRSSSGPSSEGLA